MASLRKHPRSSYWFACITLPDGRRTQRSTKQTDRRKAQRIAESFEDATNRKLTEAQARRVISDIFEIVNGKPLVSKTIREHFTDWLTSVKATTATATAAAYDQVTRDFLGLLGERADRDLTQLTAADIIQFRTATLNRVSVATTNKTLKIIKVALGQAVKTGLLETNPAAKVETLRDRAALKNERRPFTLPELRKVLAACNNEWRGIVLAGFYTGQRLGDVAALRWSAVDLERDEISFVTAKTGRRQRLPIAAPLRAHIESLPASDDPTAPLFPKAIKCSRLSNQFYDILVTAGLATLRSDANTDGTGHGRRGKRATGALSFHCLRHSATSLLKVAGVSESVAMDIIGHDSPEISRHYTHVDDAAKRAAIEKLPDLLST